MRLPEQTGDLRSALRRGRRPAPNAGGWTFPGCGTISGNENALRGGDPLSKSAFKKAAVLCLQNDLIQILCRRRWRWTTKADTRHALAEKLRWRRFWFRRKTQRQVHQVTGETQRQVHSWALRTQRGVHQRVILDPFLDGFFGGHLQTDRTLRGEVAGGCVWEMACERAPECFQSLVRKQCQVGRNAGHGVDGEECERR